MMKRFLTVGLVMVVALALCLGVAACGEEEAVETTATTAAPATTATTAVPETTSTTAVAPETTTTEAAEPTQEPITIKYATTFIETEAGGKIVQHFCDYVEDATAGAVEFDIFFGGTLGTNMEELGLVSSGSVDMVSLGHPPFADQIPLLNFPMWAPPDAQGAIDYFNYLVFDNPDTSKLIQAEAAANNVIYLGFTAGGGNVFIAKEPFTKLSDLVGKKFGAGGSIPAFEAMGYTVVQSFPPDTYENLSRGVIEATQMGFVPTVNLKWYEVCKYYMFDGTYAAGNAFTVNLDTWEKLTEETQAVMYEAAAETETFSLELDAADTEASIKLLTDAGVTVGTLSDEDIAMWWDLLFDVSAGDCMARAQNLGIVNEMTTVLTAAAEFTGVEWSPAQ
ncbi:MAG: TRAP transporter substrate-binding protein DctP [Thermoleophilia bacterium]|nr:TRAP transporter substrate-binding protein DctP [Thermoleophilia bacterium]